MTARAAAKLGVGCERVRQGGGRGPVGRDEGGDGAVRHRQWVPQLIMMLTHGNSWFKIDSACDVLCRREAADGLKLLPGVRRETCPLENMKAVTC